MDPAVEDRIMIRNLCVLSFVAAIRRQIIIQVYTSVEQHEAFKIENTVPMLLKSGKITKEKKGRDRQKGTTQTIDTYHIEAAFVISPRKVEDASDSVMMETRIN